MKVSSTEVPPRQVALDIEVDQERLDRAIEQAFRRLAGRVDVPGFRRGKAPRAMLERVVGHERIVKNALDQLVPDVVHEAIEQQGVAPYTPPRVESIEFDPLRVRATVPLAPRVELGDYDHALRVPRAEVRLDPDQVDAVIERLRDSHAQWVPVERPVRLGDRVGIDVRGTVADSGRVLLDSKDAEYVVDPAGAQPAAGFAEQLVGLEAGQDKTVSLALPDDYHDRALAGKPAQFAVHLHWLKEKQLPELDDSFAAQVGDFADLAAVRQAVEAELRRREEERLREELERAAMDKLVQISTVEIPPQLVDYQAQQMLESFTRQVEQQGLPLQQYLRLAGKEQESLRAEFRAEAEVRLKRSLALGAFAEAEGIAVEQPEAEAAEQAAGATSERRALARLVDLATSDGADPHSPAGTRSAPDADAAAASPTANAPGSPRGGGQEEP